VVLTTRTGWFAVAISCIGAIALAAKVSFAPYLETTVEHIHQLLTIREMEHVPMFCQAVGAFRARVLTEDLPPPPCYLRSYFSMLARRRLSLLTQLADSLGVLATSIGPGGFDQHAESSMQLALLALNEVRAEMVTRELWFVSFGRTLFVLVAILTKFCFITTWM